MGVPHFFQAFVCKRWTTCQQLVATNGECILIGVAARVALPVLRGHVDRRTRYFTQRSMCLRAKMQSRAKIGEQQLSIEPDQQIARFAR